MTETTETQSTNETRGCGSSGCLCAGTGPAVSGVVSHLMKEYGPSEPVRRHFMQARLEILKGLRAILDQRINDIQKQPSRGTKVTID
jgi:hypothetical protein